MSDHIIRGLRVQLTTTMDMVLRTALCEIMRVVENALHDHKMEVAQKGEEIAQLKIKLQTAEIKLKDLEFGSSRAETKQSPKKPDVSDGQTSSPPEIDFEVPDDWCAPLGYETVTKQTKMCPSVRLRQLSIPLWQVPIKKEMLNCSINLQRARGLRRSRRTAVLNRVSNPAVITKKSPVKNDVKILFKKVKQEDSELNARCLRGKDKGKNTSTDTPKNIPSKLQKKLKVRVKNKPRSAELQNAEMSSCKKFACRFCNKLFETRPGRNIHARFHRTCKGCKKVLSDVYTLRCHMQSCEIFKKRMTQEAEKRLKISCDKKNANRPRNITVKEESVEVSVNSKTFTKKCKKSHKERTNFLDSYGDPGWMRPLDYTEDN